MRPLPTVAALVAAVLFGVFAWIWSTERQWQRPLYCIARPGTLWNGLTSLPSGLTPECPQSRSYRREVRQGESRVEQYRLPGWQPKGLLELLKRAGYRQVTDDPIAPGNYAAFLERQGQMVQYLAAQEGATTLITLSGPP